MKHFLIGVVAALLLIGVVAELHAEEKSTKVKVDGELKVWNSKWSRSVPYGSSSSSAIMVLCPTIEARLPNKKIFGELSFSYPATEYKLSNGMTYKPQTVDIAIGYMVIPELGVVVGYKDERGKYEWPEYNVNESVSINGPFTGIHCLIPFEDDDFSFFGQLDYFFTKYKKSNSDGSFDEKYPGWAIEAGIKYNFYKNVTGFLGYRRAINKGSDSSSEDTFSGVTLGATMTFGGNKDTKKRNRR